MSVYVVPSLWEIKFHSHKNNWHKILNWVLVIILRIQSTPNFFMNASSQRHKDVKKKKHTNTAASSVTAGSSLVKGNIKLARDSFYKGLR